MVSRLTHKILLAVALALIAPRAFAQTPPDPSAAARIHIGPLALSPTLSLLNAGMDQNVFNEPDQALPKSDFTMTLEPKTDLWLHLGRSILSGNVTEDLVYYRTYSSQRSANHSLKVGLLVPLTRVTFRGSASYLNTRDRPGFEIDARPQRRELVYEGGVELRMLSKTSFGIKAIRQKIEFAADAVFLGNNLRTELNRQINGESLTVRHELTPLTTLTVDVGQQRDRFDFSPLRDSNSESVSFGIHFDPFALLKGNAAVGYRNFKPLVAGLPGFQGLTAAVDLSYVALGATKLSVQAGRDVQYSFDVNQPYYILTGINVSLAQQVFGPVDAVGRIGVQMLDYRDRAATFIAFADRVDYVHSYGGGVGYHVGKDLRIGFNVDNATRTSAATNRTYSGLRFGMAVTYGL